MIVYSFHHYSLYIYFLLVSQIDYYASKGFYVIFNIKIIVLIITTSREQKEIFAICRYRSITRLLSPEFL